MRISKRLDLYKKLAVQRYCLTLFFLIFILPVTSSSSEGPKGSVLRNESNRNVAKSILLHRMFGFIKWPSSRNIDDKKRPFIICFTGERKTFPYSSGDGSELSIQGKKVKFRYIHWDGNLPDCHVLFLFPPYDADPGPILSVTRGKAILTVGESAGLADKGVHINLLYTAEENRVQFELNVGEIRRSHLKIELPVLKAASRLIDIK